MYLKVFLTFLSVLALVGVNVAILDHFRDLKGVNLWGVLLWVNLNILLAVLLLFFIGRKLYREYVQFRYSDLKRKLFLSLVTVLGFPFLVLTALAVVGQSSYLRVFTDEALKNLLLSTEELERNLARINIPPDEKQKLESQIEYLRSKTSKLRQVVRQQKLVLINFTATFFLIALVVLLGAVAIASWLVRVVSGEFEKFANAMGRLAKRDFNVRIPTDSFPTSAFKELLSLAESFNKTARYLKTLYERLDRERTLFEEVFKNVTTGVALFDARDGELLKANDSYKTNFGFTNLKQLREWIKERDYIRYEERDKGFFKLVFVEDLSPFVIKKRYSAWKEIANRLAHDIKNPLHAISISFDMLEALALRIETENGKVKNPQLLEKLLEKIKSEKRQTLKQINYISDLVEAFNNLTSQEEELKREKFPLRQLLFEIKREFENDRFKVFVEISPLYLYADRTALKRVFENLVKNSYEAFKKSGKEIGVVRISNEGNKIYIKDNGPGIPPDKVESIFLPFTSTKGKGRGLGLFTVKKIVEEHGWKVYLKPPKEGQEGACFVIEVDPKDLSKKP